MDVRDGKYTMLQVKIGTCRYKVDCHVFCNDWIAVIYLQLNLCQNSLMELNLLHAKDNSIFY